MIVDLKPYPAYRAAEGEWLGEIPSHWAVRRTKYVVRETDSRSTSGKEQLLRISQYTGVTQRRRADGLEEPDTRADSLVGYKRVEPNDLVINIMLAWNGSMGVSRYSGIASPAYCVYRFGRDVHPWYFHNLLRSPAYKARIKASSTGVVESRLRLYSDDLGRIEALFPPPAEQAGIVRFLDWVNGRLERAILAKRKVIALLNEQKQAIIHRAVTRGLDPSVPLKPSGIPWLGDIPQHWEVRRCGSLFFEVVDTGHPTALLLSIDRLRGVIPQSDTGRRTRASENRSAYKHVRPGQLAYNLMNAFMGSLGFSNYDGIVSPAYAVAQPRWAIEPRFFHELFRTAAYTGEFNRLSYGIMYERNRLYFERFKLVPVLIPPFAEQREIAQGIHEQTAELNTTISRLEREIELLREYRTRLVADVVTGKLDVREAATHLPEEAAPDTVEDAVDLSDETELADEEAAV